MAEIASSVLRRPIEAVRSAAQLLFRESGAVWLHVIKTVFAGLLALGLSMLLELPQPRTALVTVFIVMQPQSGPVLAKSFFRLAGTFVGSAMMLCLLSLFSQQPELFIGSLALWIGICAAGASRSRDFRAYAFVLAGYTAALTGIPTVMHPLGAFDAAVTRMLEVTMGIVCSALTSTLFFPSSSSLAFHTRQEARMRRLFTFVGRVFSEATDGQYMMEENAHLLGESVGLESMRRVASFEDPELRQRSRAFLRFNHEFMAVCTRLHAFNQLRSRLDSAGSTTATGALAPYMQELGAMMHEAGSIGYDGGRLQLARIESGLRAFVENLPTRLAMARSSYRDEYQGVQIEDFDTAVELFVRLSTELHGLLRADMEPGQEGIGMEATANFRNATPLVVSIVAGLRPAALVAMLGAFWIASAWDSGGMAVLGAAAIGSLCAQTSQPARVASQMAVGTLLSAICGCIVVFLFYPMIDGFPLLCVTLAPFLIFGSRLSLSRRWPGVGVGFCIFFCFSAGPDNPAVYNPVAFINDNLALVLSMIGTALAYSIIVPPGSAWLRRRLMLSLRAQMALAAYGELPALAAHFESGTRDMVHQLSTWSDVKPENRQLVLRWMLLILEVGRALIELRAHARALGKDGTHTVLLSSIDDVRFAVASLFRRPDALNLRAARQAVSGSIVHAKTALRFEGPAGMSHTHASRALADLHFIRTALRDSDSPVQLTLNASRLARGWKKS